MYLHYIKFVTGSEIIEQSKLIHDYYNRIFEMDITVDTSLENGQMDISYVGYVDVPMCSDKSLTKILLYTSHLHVCKLILYVVSCD